MVLKKEHLCLVCALTFHEDILGDLMEKLANRSLQTSTTKTVSLENAVDVLKTLQAQRIGKVVAAF